MIDNLGSFPCLGYLTYPGNIIIIIIFIFRSIQPNLLSSSSLLIGSWHRTAFLMLISRRACIFFLFDCCIESINQVQRIFFLFFMKAGLSGLCEGMEGREGLLLVWVVVWRWIYCGTIIIIIVGSGFRFFRVFHDPGNPLSLSLSGMLYFIFSLFGNSVAYLVQAPAGVTCWPDSDPIGWKACGIMGA